MKGRPGLSHVQVYDSRAYEDILTYGPQEIVIKILLNMDLDGIQRAYKTSKRLRDICQTEDFRQQYFDLHSEEILGKLEWIVPIESIDEIEWKGERDVDKKAWNEKMKRDVTDSEIDFYNIWSKIAGDRWDPSVNDDAALSLAVIYNRPKEVKLLLADPRVDPSADENDAIQQASKKGFVEIVKLLLADPRVDPSGNDDWTMNLAYTYYHDEVVDLLKKWYRKHGKEIPDTSDFVRDYITGLSRR